MADRNEDMHVTAPRFKFEWNLNSIVIIGGFVAGIAAWGGTWERVNNSLVNVNRIEARVAVLETTSRILDNHEQRIVTVEANARDAATNTRVMQDTMGKLATDMAVVREILQRLEQGQGGQR